MKLKSKWFYDVTKITVFVNANNISKENIQAVVGDEKDGYHLLYWGQDEVEQEENV